MTDHDAVEGDVADERSGGVSRNIDLTADDGHEFGAYEVSAQGTMRGGLIVVHEIFGVNHHIRDMCNRFAAHGYACLAPALFDRIERDLELGYDEDSHERAMHVRSQVDWESVVVDIGAAARYLGAAKTTALIGYCFGGSAAWLAAAHVDLGCTIGYYGATIVPYLDRKPRCPIMLHFAERDVYVPSADVDRIRGAYPELPVHTYPAEHGFVCEERPAYDPASAQLAEERTMAFLATHLH